MNAVKKRRNRVLAVGKVVNGKIIFTKVRRKKHEQIN